MAWTINRLWQCALQHGQYCCWSLRRKKQHQLRTFSNQIKSNQSLFIWRFSYRKSISKCLTEIYKVRIRFGSLISYHECWVGLLSYSWKRSVHCSLVSKLRNGTRWVTAHTSFSNYTPIYLWTWNLTLLLSMSIYRSRFNVLIQIITQNCSSYFIEQNKTFTHPPFLIHAVVIYVDKLFWIPAWLVDMRPEILVGQSFIKCRFILMIGNWCTGYQRLFSLAHIGK